MEAKQEIPEAVLAVYEGLDPLRRMKLISELRGVVESCHGHDRADFSDENRAIASARFEEEVPTLLALPAADRDTLQERYGITIVSKLIHTTPAGAYSLGEDMACLFERSL